MEFIKSWKFMAIIVGVLVAAAIAGVVYGVVTHNEAGGDPAMDFDYGPGAISTCVASYSSTSTSGRDDASEVDLGEVDRASRIINDRVGLDLLDVGSIADTRCEILVTVGVPFDETWNEAGGRAWRCHDSCCIETSNTGTVELTALVLQHELGHCLGLAHDEWSGSIMRPVQVPTPDGEFPPRITDSDRELLRTMYAAD